ncbi:ionic transporter y4hA [Chryseobacterium formosus]|uniref:Ionic transporter y4hA n=1 Tax=Chryseobacterium formosus TaxID=1537363 RepID=A0ABT3XK64_9FLAO|nr:ionic transporter y4hA [Chryseobacterium formosus]MCX8522535.1 ionic transporter y4hA [Chryseobacterium formosus]
MKLKDFLHYTYIFPVLAVIYYFLNLMGSGVIYDVIAGILLTGSVLSAVHHAEVVAHKVGEPYGTIILALCITIIEVALIVSLMVAGGEQAITLARDTVFAAVMIILNGIIGICVLVGGVKYFEQFFARTSATTYLVSIVSILVITLVLPNFTSSVNGPYYNNAQLVFVSIACIVIYGVFLMVQTVRHRSYFVPADGNAEEHFVPNKTQAIVSFLFLVVCLVIVVLLAKGLSKTIEDMVQSMGAPKSLVGVIIAGVVLLPEGVAAIRAARNNQIQSSLNLALGSALASIGLSIPAISAVSIMYDIPLVLGLDKKDIILLTLSVFIVMLSLSRGKTNVLYGTVLLVNLAAYIFTVIVP